MLPKAKQERNTNDRYLTRPDFADWAMNALPINLNPKRVFDPGLGDTAALSLALLRRWPQARISAIDIRPISKPRGVDTLIRGDFTTWWMKQYVLKKRMDYDLIICNPPFSEIIEFIQASVGMLRQGGRALFIVKLSILEGDERFNSIWDGTFGQDLEHVSVCAKRPKFSSFKSADGTAYALMVFRQGHTGGATISFNHFDDKKAAGWCDYFRTSGFSTVG
jgi:hypothetical protein